MPRPLRLLDSVDSTPVDDSAGGPRPVDSDFVVILAALLCALICVLGLVAVVRCAWIRRLSSSSSSGAAGSGESRPPPPPRPSAANKGLKKKILRALPKETFSAEYAAKFTDCAICLAEFAVGDEIRLLPQCGHGFHVKCIDTWLGSHSSCPSCRQITVASRCQKCGGLPPPPPPSSSSCGETEARLKAREDDGNRFLP